VFKNRIYVVWADGRYGRTQILSSYSSDKGKTWSSPILVNDDPPTMGDGPDNFMPAVAVNPNGIVGVMWYDRRENTDFGYYVRFAASMDGGETWQPSVRVSTSPKAFEIKETGLHGTLFGSQDGRRSGTAPLYIRISRYEWESGGHTAGLAADMNGAFHPFWVDNRTGVSQIWTASVSVSGAAIKNGAPDLANLDDVSAFVEVELTKCEFEKSSNVLSCSAKLKNTSKESLKGPFKLRVIGLRSELGHPRIANADNRQTGSGAVWDFSEQVSKQSLAPGETSDLRQLRFEILNLRPFRQGNFFKKAFVAMDARVLGHLNKNPL
jgi:hypothetical protein